MAAGPAFEAGSILISLRASAEGLQKEIQKANDTLTKFGKQVQGVATVTERTSETVVNSFSAMDRKTLQTTARIAQFSQRLLGLQFILQSFSGSTGKAGDSMETFKEKASGAIGGLATFAGIVSIFPNQIGLVVAAAAGLAIVVADIVKQFTKAGDEIQEFNKQVEELEKARAARQRERDVEGIRLQQLRIAGIGDAASTEAAATRNLAEQQRIIADLTDAEDRRLKAVQARDALERRLLQDLEQVNRARTAPNQEFGPQAPLSFAEGTSDKAQQELADLTAAAVQAGIETDNLRKFLQLLDKQGQDLKDKGNLEASFNAAISAMSKFGEESARLRVRLEQGVITPAEEAAAQLANAKAELEAFTALGANAQRRLSVLVDTKQGESAFDALNRRILEAKENASQIELKISGEAEIKRLSESFAGIRTELESTQRVAEKTFVDPLKLAQQELDAAEKELAQFLALTPAQRIGVNLEVLGTEDALNRLVGQVDAARARVGDVEVNIRVRGQLDEVEEVLRDVEQQATATGKAFDLGLVNSTQAVNENISNVETSLRKLIEFQSKLQPFDTAALSASQTAIDALLVKLDKLKNEGVPIEVRIEDFNRTFAEPFSRAIGDAVSTGILEGQDSMEILANVGKNLFTQFLNDAIAGFQKGMVKAFDAIAGAGGEALGGLLGAAAGIAGFFIANEQAKGSTKQFNAVEGATESTEAVRGIVAGPESVAIASVGDNLRRAMIGVEERLDALIAVTVQIRNGQGVGGASGSGAPFAGTVPTS